MDAERQRIINEAARLVGEINQIFVDVQHWNDRAWDAHGPIDPDPDGQLAAYKLGLDGMLKLEAERGNFPTGTNC